MTYVNILQYRYYYENYCRKHIFQNTTYNSRDKYTKNSPWIQKNYDKTPWFDLFDPGLPVWSWCLSFFRCNAPYCLFGTLQGILRKHKRHVWKKTQGLGLILPGFQVANWRVFFGISYVRILGGGGPHPTYTGKKCRKVFFCQNTASQKNCKN